MRRSRVLALLGVLAGCFNSNVDYASGDLRCESGTGSCPPGFVCAWNSRCYLPSEIPAEPQPDAMSGCVENARRCQGTTQQTCTGGEFVDIGVCDIACLEGFCVTCVPDDKRCNDNQPQQCNSSGGWNDLAACSPPTPLCDDGVCVAGCTQGSKRCSPTAAAVQECDVRGVYRTIETCPFVCANSTCGGECVPTSERCGPDQTPQTCSALGMWVNGTACVGICTGGGDCAGECHPGDKRCGAGNQLQSCGGDGTWAAGMPCAFAVSSRNLAWAWVERSNTACRALAGIASAM